MKDKSEKKADWYDDAYESQLRKGGQYSLSPEKTMYAGSWEKVLSWIDSNERILELGCGVGQFAQMLIEAEKSYVYGFDFSTVAIENAKKINPEHNYRFMAKDIKEPSIYHLFGYDVIVCLEVLEHIADDRLIIKNVPSGKRVIFSVPNYMCSSHVRCFDDGPSIHKRYGELIKINRISRIKMSSGGKCIWICDAIRL